MAVRIAGFVALLMLAAAPVAASAQPIVAEMLTESVEAGGGELITLRLRVQNTGDAPQSLSAHLDLPDAWRPLASPSAQLVPPKGAIVIVLPLVLPRSVPAGSYEPMVRLLSDDGKEVARASIRLRVAEQRAVEAVVAAAPRYSAGEAYRVEFLVRNLGNVDQLLRVELDEQYGFPVLLETPVEFELKAGAATSVAALVEPIEAAAPLVHALTLEVSGVEDGALLATAVAVVEALQTRSPLEAGYRTLDMRIGAELRSEGVVAPKLESPGIQLTGSGPLLKEDDELSFALAAGSGAGGHEQLLSYSRSAFRLQLGDQDVRSTPLLEGVSGFGVSLRTPGGRRVEERGRAYVLVGEELAVGFEAREQVHEGFDVSTGLHMRPGSAQVISGVAFLLENESREELTVVARQAVDLTTLATGFSVELGGAAPSYSLAADLSYTSAGYGGRASPGYSYGGELRMRSAERQRPFLQAAYRESRWGTAETGRGASVEIGARPSASSWSLRYLYHLGRDDSGLERRQSVRFRTRLETRGRIALAPTLWWEREDDLEEPGFEEVLGAEFEIELPVARGEINPGVHVEYGTDERSLEQLDLYLGWQRGFDESSQLRFFGSLGLMGDEPFELWTEGRHELEGGSRFSATANLKVDRDGLRRFEAEVGVSVPFQIAVARRSDVGTVRGVIRDWSGNAVPGLLVSLAGASSRSTTDGSFHFPAVPPGRHALTVYGVEPGSVVYPALPQLIEVAAGEGRTVELKVARAAEIRAIITVGQGTTGADGRVIVGKGAGVDEAELVRGLVVTLSGPGGVRRAVVSADGSARFSHLPPGEWTLEVSSDSVPEYYRVEPDHVSTELAEGEVAEVRLQLIPVVRRIQFQDGGVVGN